MFPAEVKGEIKIAHEGIHIHQNIRAYPRSKKICTDQDYENIIAYSEESEQREMQANKFGLFQTYLGGLRVSATSGKFDYFYSHLSLETVFPALKLTQNCYINVNISFS